MSKSISFVQGNEAIALGAMYAGLDFYAGYPITPSTEVAESLAMMLPAAGKKFIQMEDEIASMGAVLGASLGGMKAMTATSGPGFSLLQGLEALIESWERDGLQADPEKDALEDRLVKAAAAFGADLAATV